MRKILVVEDEDAIREVIALNLRMAGYEVAEAASAERALGLLGEEKDGFDVALLDVMLPGMNGFSLCETIRRDSAELGIIILSAKTQEKDKINGLSIGADDYITKPFSVTELLARVEALCRRVTRQATEQQGESRLVSGQFVLDQKSRVLYKNGQHFQNGQLTEAAKPYFIYRRAKSVSLRAADGRGPIIATVDGECAPCKQVSVQVQPLAGRVLLPLPAYQRFTAKKAGVK